MTLKHLFIEKIRGPVASYFVVSCVTTALGFFVFQLLMLGSTVTAYNLAQEGVRKAKQELAMIKNTPNYLKNIQLSTEIQHNHMKLPADSAGEPNSDSPQLSPAKPEAPSHLMLKREHFLDGNLIRTEIIDLTSGDTINILPTKMK